MPTYDYKCPQCGHTEERITSAFLPNTPLCEDCGVSMERYLPKPPGSIMNGRGFYGSTYGKGPGRVK